MSAPAVSTAEQIAKAMKAKAEDAYGGKVSDPTRFTVQKPGTHRVFV